MDVWGEAVVDGQAGAINIVWDHGGLVPEAETEGATEGVKDEVEVDSEGAEDGIEDGTGYLMHDLRDLMRDACARWEEANLGLLVDVVGCAAKTRQVVIREVAGGTAIGPVEGEVVHGGGCQ